ncbi:hypothetical protein OsJ_24242 [Oryza sativa Japonica Group]|uniref:Uncharacterized protein n=1 Tax=Oryza sativa subsp. japonica TaxID=39947 RepID=A3BJR2_ORYSJ|nr:hypothetical protein OsJ_24242 [Oryza sativa Japonica Group]
MAWRRRRSRGGLNPVATDDVEDDGDSAKDGGGHRVCERREAAPAHLSSMPSSTLGQQQVSRCKRGAVKEMGGGMYVGPTVGQ